MLIKKLTAVAAAGAVTAAAGVFAKRKKDPEFCPKCEIKKAISKLGFHYSVKEKYDNGISLTPPMGWSSWNTFRQNIDEKLIVDTAEAMKKSGLLDAGYCYINLDDCWQSSVRDKDGRLQGDLASFPNGIKPLVESLNTLGFKAGIYSSNGTLTCEDLPASLGNERIDAETFAQWGIEYFKYDFCHNKPVSSEAPLLCELIVTEKDGDEVFKLTADDAVLYGSARLVCDSDGSFISGLDCASGKAAFTVGSVETDGEYILTVVYRKKRKDDKFATLTVNNTECTELHFPPTKAWSKFGKVQTSVRLIKGENLLLFENPIASKADSAAYLYTKMGRELKRATRLYAESKNLPEKPIVYSICEWGLNKPYKWGAQAGNLWRTTPDIQPFWASVVGIYEHNEKLADYASKGAWNDPDMLEVGNGKLTVDENKAHFTLWCMMAAPLILGNDIRKFIKPDGTVDYSDKILQILTNRDLIAVNQDSLGIQCKRIKTNLLCDVLVKPLDNHEAAVCIFNKSKSRRRASVSLKEVANLTDSGLPQAGRYELFDLWSKDVSFTSDKIICDLAPHSVAVYRVKTYNTENK